jgi:hypothetical protein
VINFGKPGNGKYFDIFYNHLVHFVAIRFILCQIGIFLDHVLNFSRFGTLYQEQSGNPAVHDDSDLKEVVIIVNC